MIIPFKAGVLTVSDRSSQGIRADESGALLKSLLDELSMDVIAYQVIPDELKIIEKTLTQMADLFLCDLILTTGGTGLSPRDQTPAATRNVIDREIPGIAEAIRSQSIKKTPFAMLSCALAGLRNRTLIINCPGSPKAVKEIFVTLRPVLFHALQSMKGMVRDCQSRSSHLQPSY